MSRIILKSFSIIFIVILVMSGYISWCIYNVYKEYEDGRK
jgi:hypothetical protein